MAEPFYGEIKIVAFNFAPKGWAFCDGQVMPINQNQALFAILGTMYGGNGINTFALPDLRGRAPMHVGGPITEGQVGGEENHTLTVQEMPAHIHIPMGSSTAGNKPVPTGNVWAQLAASPYSTNAPDGQMNPASVLPFGQSQPHTNQQPCLALNFIIALLGIFPSRN